MTMARQRVINDIYDDEDGLVDYSGDSDDDNNLKDHLPENAFRCRPAPDLGAVDITQQKQCSILR
jgi:hypothetical protein